MEHVSVVPEKQGRALNRVYSETNHKYSHAVKSR